MPLFGAHMSISGSLPESINRLRRVKGESLQIFTKNQRQWQVPPLSAEEVAAFRQSRLDYGPGLPLAAHDSYLINMANPEPVKAERAMAAFAEELERCRQLAIPFLVSHPGAHLGSGVEAGLATLVENLDRALERFGSEAVRVLLETTAGQGTTLGSRFEEIAFILSNSRFGHRLGVCFDTCHVFAAGYDLRTPEAYEATMAEFGRLIGLDRLHWFHLNDSKGRLGSHLDRHQHIGQGEIGLAGFALLVNDPRFSKHPMVLETPKGLDLEEDRRNLATLRGLLASGG